MPNNFSDTSALGKHYHPEVGTPKVDALQLAVALDLRSKGALDQFICADKVLLGIAASEGLTVVDPEIP